MPEVSIIVPVYNAEKYLNRCIDSLLNQTFTDFEILLVDDGSTDNSYNICSEYEKLDNRVKVIQLNHCGVARIRNQAMKIAEGKYLMFCDSDDYVEDTWIETLYNAIIEYPDSLVLSGYNEINLVTNKSKKLALNDINKPTFYPLDESYLFIKNVLIYTVWNKIFLRSTIINNNLTHDTIVREGSDVLFVMKYIKYCQNILYLPSFTYNYLYNGTPTIIRSFDAHRYNSLGKIYLSFLDIVDKKDIPELSNKYFDRFIDCISYVHDERNTESKRLKIKYSNFILRDKAFRTALKNTKKGYISWKLKFIFFLKNYRIFNLYTRLAKFRKQN